MNPIEKVTGFVKSNPLKSAALASVGVLAFVLSRGSAGAPAGTPETGYSTAGGYTLVGSASTAPEAQLASATQITLARIAAGAKTQELMSAEKLGLASINAQQALGTLAINTDKQKTLDSNQKNYALANKTLTAQFALTNRAIASSENIEILKANVLQNITKMNANTSIALRKIDSFDLDKQSNTGFLEGFSGVLDSFTKVAGFFGGVGDVAGKVSGTLGAGAPKTVQA